MPMLGDGTILPGTRVGGNSETIGSYRPLAASSVGEGISRYFAARVESTYCQSSHTRRAGMP